VSWKKAATPRKTGRAAVLLLCLVGAFVVALNATGGQHTLVAAGVNGLDYAPPDTVLFNGKISTQDAKDSTVQAIAIRGGDVLAVGTNVKVKQLAGKKTRMIDLGGRRVVPGQIDGHLHGLRNGYHCFTNATRLDNVYKRSDALRLFANKAKHVSAGQWLWIQSGWNPKQFSDKPGMFTLAELDQVLPGNPVDFRAGGVAGIQTNSAGLKALGLAAGSPGVVLDASGQPTGQLTGPAQTAADARIIAQVDANSIDVQKKCVADFIREANANGLTAWMDSAGNQQPFNPAGACLEALQGLHDHQAVIDLWRNKQLNARIDFEIMNQFSGYAQMAADQRHQTAFLGDDMLRNAGVGEEVECPGNAPLVGPSANVPDLAVDYQKLVDFLAANHMGFQHHASAKATQDSELAAWSKANEIYPIAKLRWTMAHPGDDGVSPTPDTLAVAKQLGIGMVPGDAGLMGIGTARPLIGNILRSGVHLCLGTDAMNVAPYPPFGVLYYAVSGKSQDPASPGLAPDQVLTRQQALDARTKNCAWNMFQDGKLGRLSPGYHADLIVLDRDYFTEPVEQIKDTRSLLTVVGGRIVYASPKGPWAKLDPCYSKMGGQAWVKASADTFAIDLDSC
jgi:predicted amidohydrolase YtcJ